jgi:hypothetical protein
LALARENHKILTDDASYRNQNTPPWEQCTLSWPKEKYLELHQLISFFIKSSFFKNKLNL